MKRTLKAIKCHRILTPDRTVERGLIIIEGSAISAVVQEQGFPVSEEAEFFDLGELTVLPGFIDVHIHGWGGHDFRSRDPQSLLKVSALLPFYGVTTYLPTICDVPEQEMLEVIERVSLLISSQTGGSNAAGLHLEGPFLNPSRKGAMRSATLCQPDPRLLGDYLACGGGRIRMVTLSPELEGAMDTVQRLDEAGVVACMGHSEATYAQAVAAIRKGVRHAVHTFNAMGPFHHREPGVVGAVLTHETVTAEVIADGVHLHPAAVKLLLRAKGESRVVTVSDAHPLAGMRPGNYRDVNGRELLVGSDAVRLKDGTLAGGGTPMNILIKNLAELAGISLQGAVASATINPARLLGIEGKTGSLEAGKDADMTAVDDNFNVRFTMVKGEVVT